MKKEAYPAQRNAAFVFVFLILLLGLALAFSTAPKRPVSAQKAMQEADTDTPTPSLTSSPTFTNTNTPTLISGVLTCNTVVAGVTCINYGTYLDYNINIVITGLTGGATASGITIGTYKRSTSGGYMGMSSDFMHCETSNYPNNKVYSSVRLKPFDAGAVNYPGFTSGAGMNACVANLVPTDWRYIPGTKGYANTISVRGNVDWPITGYSIVGHIYLYSNQNFMTVTPTMTPSPTATATMTKTPTATPTPTAPPVPLACGQQLSYTVIDSYTYESNAISPITLLPEGQALSDDESIKNVIQAYFILRYESEKNLAVEDFALVSVNKDPDAVEWLAREENRQNILRHNAELFNTQYLDYKFSLDYISLDINDAMSTVRLLENHWVRYEANPDFVAHLANMEHTIALKKIDGRWRIVADNYPVDLLNRALDTMSEEEILRNMQRNHEFQFLEAPASGIEMTATPLNLPGSMLAAYPYNNSAAKNYADNWYSGTGPVPNYIKSQTGWSSGWPTLYCRYAITDCTNFVSQALFEGTRYAYSQIDYFNPDYTHWADWWYYKFSPDVDGSYPWVNTGGLYDFLTTNTGRGPYGSATNLCSLSPGDIIFMKDGSAWQHAVIVSDIIGSCNNATNIVVDGHSADEQELLSNFSEYTWHPVAISGYNK